jgi:hypothetical protein
MNLKVLAVSLAGLAAFGLLYVFPPWQVDGSYVGHLRIDRVAWLELDSKRFYAEQAAIALATLLAAIKVWKKRS